MSLNRAVRYGMSGALAALLVTCLAAPVSAQEPADPNPGNVTFTGGIDFVSQYMFRGIRQNSTGIAMWPYGDIGLAVYSGDGGLKSTTINFGTWNSLHTGDTGQDNATNGKLWYESDFYATLGFGFGGGTSVGVTYTAYVSPNNAFTSVKEVAFKFGVDDTPLLGGAAVRPYVLVAKELDTAPFVGQADGGLEAGTYMELGIAPGFAASRFSVAVPVKVGLSLSDYYEGAAGDERFGFFSLAGIVTVPFTSAPSRVGTWNVHGGIEYLRLGDRNQGFGENQVVGSLGIGFTY